MFLASQKQPCAKVSVRGTTEIGGTPMLTFIFEKFWALLLIVADGLGAVLHDSPLTRSLPHTPAGGCASREMPIASCCAPFGVRV
jgi:hypothetical protein